MFDSPYGLAAPAGTSAERIQVLHDAFRKGMREPEFLRVMENFGQRPRYMNTADYTADNIKTFADERVPMHKLGLAKP